VVIPAAHFPRRLYNLMDLLDLKHADFPLSHRDLPQISRVWVKSDLPAVHCEEILMILLISGQGAARGEPIRL
jgi:hypothetical protein